MSANRPTAKPQPARMRRLVFFREFTLAEVRRVAGTGNLRLLRDGELLATEGTRKQRRILYLVEDGELQYIKRIRGQHAEVVLRLRPGDVGGFLTFFNEDPSPVSVRSRGRTRVFELGQREFEMLSAADPSLAVKLLAAVIRETVRHLEALPGRIEFTSAWRLDLDRLLLTLPPLGGDRREE
jgi:CRP-like cAMP-binding protein